MARPILAALSDETIARVARERVQAIAGRPLPEVSSPPAPAFPDVDWTDDDRLIWEEFIAGVPCQGCGRAFLGDETSQGDGELWAAYRARMEPIETEFASRHPGHGTRWTVGGGPLHCRRCCAPHPLSPQQIRQISRILNPPPAPAAEIPVRRCKTCRQPLESGHVCRLDDLPADLRKVVDAVLRQELDRRGS
jgi:hypothetical protein